MTQHTERQRIRADVAALRARAAIPVDVVRRGPVPLDALIEQLDIVHVALPALCRRAVRERLLRDGIPFDLEADDRPLAGFVVAGPSVGYLFVNQDDPLPRRRFTAAHELGHFRLHRSADGPGGYWSVGDEHDSTGSDGASCLTG